MKGRIRLIYQVFIDPQFPLFSVTKDVFNLYMKCKDGLYSRDKYISGLQNYRLCVPPNAHGVRVAVALVGACNVYFRILGEEALARPRR